jgi:CAAD domains of cyanobacterial aminoacyl-tRNA synthetase
MATKVRNMNEQSASAAEVATQAEAVPTKMDVSLEEAGTLTKISATNDEFTEQWQQILDRATDLLSGLPDYLGQFFGEYKQPLTTVSIIVGSVIAAKVVLAILAAVNEVPLLAPSFELIGMSYSAWFLYRYILKAQNRVELTKEIEHLKEEVVGRK